MKTILFLCVLIICDSGQGASEGYGGLAGVKSWLNNLAGNVEQEITIRIPNNWKSWNPAKLPLPGTVRSFTDFVSKTGKTYASKAEQTLRRGIFEAYRKVVDKHNKLFQSGRSTFEMGLNFLSDLKPNEFLSGLTGRKKKHRKELEIKNMNLETETSVSIPDSIDWRKKGGVTPVKFQGLQCGACWSFAVTGSIEGHVFRKTGELINLSEQHLLDCSSAFGNEGCDGGYHDYAYEYIIANKGISKADAYPFIEKTQDQCYYNESNIGTTIKGYATIPPGNETLLKEIVGTLGPVAASVNAGPDSFQLYKGGIYDDEECNEGEVNHEILIVGYGSDNGKDYWIIKNQWTDKWGEHGYMKLPRNAKNFCGIATEPSYPIV